MINLLYVDYESLTDVASPQPAFTATEHVA